MALAEAGESRNECLQQASQCLNATSMENVIVSKVTRERENPKSARTQKKRKKGKEKERERERQREREREIYIYIYIGVCFFKVDCLTHTQPA